MFLEVKLNAQRVWMVTPVLDKWFLISFKNGI